MSRKAGIQIIKDSSSEVVLDADWDGTSTTVVLDGDRPIVSLAINLSTGGTLTFFSVVGGTDYTILGSDGAALSVDASTITESQRFYPEIAGVRNLKITCSASQTNATVIGSQSS